MDSNPDTYDVMAKELDREGKAAPFGVAAGEKDIRSAKLLVRRLSAMLARCGVDRHDPVGGSGAIRFGSRTRRYRHPRGGYVRTTVELPPGTSRKSNRRNIVRVPCCRLPPEATPWRIREPARFGPSPRCFSFERDYTPGTSFWWTDEPVTLSTGTGITFPP